MRIACASFAAMLALAAAGCNRKMPNAATTAPSPDVPVVVENFGPALTDEDCSQFAAEFGDAIQKKPSVGPGMLDIDALFKRAADGVDLSPATLNGFKSSFNERTIFARFAAELGQGATYRFLRVRRKNDQPHVLFRLETSEGTVNYHNFLLARQTDGRIRAVDMYIFLSGEYVSQTFRRMILSLAAQEQRGLLDRLAGRDQDFVKYHNQMKQMLAATQSGKAEEGLQLFDQLPASLQNEKFIRIIQIQAASKMSNDRFVEAVEQYRTLFPNDPSCDLISFDYFFLKKDYDRTIQAIDVVDKAVGGDPYLDAMRANVYSESGNVKLAKECARKAIKNDPKLQSAYWAFVTIALKEKDHAETVKWLNELSDKFNMQFKDLTKEESYKDFVKSPEYRAWLEARKGN